MCLAVPGKVIEATENPLGMSMGTVDFGGIRKEICLAWVPEAEVGDYVLVHVGFAISRIDEQAAHETLAALEEMGELAELEASPEDPGAPTDGEADQVPTSEDPDQVR
jgi:hydrogenase expression/formation protein HypC